MGRQIGLIPIDKVTTWEKKQVIHTGSYRQWSFAWCTNDVHLRYLDMWTIDIMRGIVYRS